ncbi:MAG TPA: hypothetical protein PLM05_11300, partial [Bacteroidales bacterium]|nr:hypothetical protein [Bacteroidales bacterium]
GLIVTHLLGVRREWGRFVIDPVMPTSLDGIEASLIIMGRTVTFVYHVIEGCSGPKRITVNGRDVAFTPVENQYRPCGAAVDESLFEGMLPGSENRVDIYL